MRKKKWPLTILLILLCLALLAGVGALAISGHVRHRTEGNIRSPEAVAELDADCILVLGCYVQDDGTPSDMLRDRLERGLSLYALGAAPKLLMSGDHGRTGYDEVNAMKDYAMAAGVPSADVFMDHAGFSTYESLYRARDVFQAKKVILVTQEYHLYRALYIAERLGLEAYGVAADDHIYAGQWLREAREILARVKDFGKTILQPKPTFLGDPIPVSGSGDWTND